MSSHWKTSKRILYIVFPLPNNVRLFCYIAYIHDFYIHSSKHIVKLADMVPQKTEDNTVSTIDRQQTKDITH